MIYANFLAKKIVDKQQKKEIAPQVTIKIAPTEVARTGQGGAKAIATRSRNSRAQDNVEREQMKAG